MKKIAGILICIALAFSFAGCSWQIPQKVSVKTDADYNFALGNFEKDFSENLSVSKMIGDLQLPNNGKVYDYWPDKKGDTQAFLMYMPLQEIPIDIGSYFDKGTLADNINNISFKNEGDEDKPISELEITIPEVSISIPIDLDEVNNQINRQFVLAGTIDDYNFGEFGKFLSQIAQSITYEKGYLVVKAYSLGGVDPRSISSIQDAITDESNVDTSYNYGTVSITSDGKSISGTFYNGIAVLEIPSSGFEFKSSDININFTDKPKLMGVPTKAFIARMDTSRPYQIKKISGIGSSITVDPINIEKNNIDALSSLETADVEECKIGEGKIDLKLPEEWEGVSLQYKYNITGGISDQRTVYSSDPISLNGKKITAEKLNIDADVILTIAGGTIDFTVSPEFLSQIEEIESVTKKLSATSLTQDLSQKLPEEALKLLKEITIGQCGLEGTYTNTLPEGNDITLTVSSAFFDISNKALTIESEVEDKEFKLLNSDFEDYTKTIELTKDDPAPSGKFNAFDFSVNFALPGGESDKITVHNVKLGQTYKLAIDVNPVINWESVILDTSSLPSKSDKMATGFNPSSIFKSIDDVLGEGFSDNIEIPDCNLYLYLTKPDLDALDDLSFNSTSISMFYGKKDGDNPPVKIESFQKDIIKNGKYRDQNNQEQEIDFADAAPDLTIEQIKSIVETKEDGKTVEKEVVTDTVVSKMSASDASCVIKLSDLLTSVPEADVEGAELCIDYAVSLAGLSGDEGITITKEDLDNATTNVGSIGIYAIIELPLSFNVAANSTINLKDLINKEDSSESSEESEDENKDLFGRKDASDLTEIEKYLKVIDTAVINYRLDSFPIKTSDDIEFEITMGDNEKSITKNLSFNTDETEQIVITNDEVMQLLNMYPLELKTANVEFPSSTSISIPRTKNLDINLQIGISTNGEPIEIFGGNK